jgi:hypothetical protein
VDPRTNHVEPELPTEREDRGGPLRNEFVQLTVPDRVEAKLVLH